MRSRYVAIATWGSDSRLSLRGFAVDSGSSFSLCSSACECREAFEPQRLVHVPPLGLLQFIEQHHHPAGWEQY